MMNQTINIVLVVLFVVAIVSFIRLRQTTGRSVGYFDSLARQAGHDPDQLRFIYWLSKAALAMMLPAVLWTAVDTFPSVPLLLALVFVGFMIPDFTLFVQRNARQKRILSGLSFFLDLVVSFLRSGLTLEESVNRAASRGFVEGHPLADEVRIVGDEISAGKDRAAAFGALARRTNIPDIHAVASALELGSRLGFPVAEILAAQADLQREKRMERGRRKIDRSAIAALFPVFLCGFPLFSLVVVLPTVMHLMETFQLYRGFLSN